MGLLRNPANQDIIQKIVDDTSSLKATISAANSEAGRASALSQEDSAIDSKGFEWDDEIINAATYRRALTHARSMANVVEPTKKRDTGGEDRHQAGAGCSDLPLPGNEPLYSKRKQNRLPYRDLVVSEPVEAYRQRSSHVPPFLSLSGSTLGRKNVFSLPSNFPAPERKSFWSSLDIIQRGRRRSAGQPVTQSFIVPTTPTSSSLRCKRGSHSNFRTSIGSNPIDGLAAPAIIRAAEAGSVGEVELLLDRGANIETRHLKSKRTAVAVAAHCGNVDVVDLLLQHGAKVDVHDVSMMTPLHLAASRGHYLVAEMLLQNLADINAKGPNDETPLRIASDNGYIDVVELFLRSRAKVNARDCQQLTALHMAAKRGDEAMVGLLACNGAHVDAKDANFMAAIHHASAEGHDGVVNLLLSKKADINAPGKGLYSPLACAASAGQTHVVELLLKRKASVKRKSEGDMNPLHLASSNGHVEVVELLLQKRSSANHPTKDGMSPLHFAVRSDNFAVVELLLRRGALIEARCQATLRSLHYACREAGLDVVQLLLGSGADLEAEDRSARRPLHFAASRGSAPLVELLVRRGADKEAQDAAGRRPLCLASALGHLAIVRMLLDSGSPITAKFSKRPTHKDSPLCIACKNGHISVVSEFVARGASVVAADELEWLPLRYAASYGHPDVVEFLLSNGASVSEISSHDWGFGPKSSSMGFAMDVSIGPERRQRVLQLLYNVDTRERATQERLTTGLTALANLQQVRSSEPMNVNHGSGSTRVKPLLWEGSLIVPSTSYTSTVENCPLPATLGCPSKEGSSVAACGLSTLYEGLEPASYEPFTIPYVPGTAL